MSIHKSLSGGSKLVRHRNVLTRAERIAKLEKEGKWNEENGIYGIPKVRNIMPKAKKKAPKEAETEEAATLETETELKTKKET